jgi:hypothetical protein
MRIIVGLIAILMTGTAARAYDTFIPMGAGYSTEVSSIPALNSDEEKVISQTDLYETELYAKQRAEREHDSYINRFFSNSETSGSDFSIDY